MSKETFEWELAFITGGLAESQYDAVKATIQTALQNAGGDAAKVAIGEALTDGRKDKPYKMQITQIGGAASINAEFANDDDDGETMASAPSAWDVREYVRRAVDEGHTKGVHLIVVLDNAFPKEPPQWPLEGFEAALGHHSYHDAFRPCQNRGLVELVAYLLYHQVLNADGRDVPIIVHSEKTGFMSYDGRPVYLWSICGIGDFCLTADEDTSNQQIDEWLEAKSSLLSVNIIERLQVAFAAQNSGGAIDYERKVTSIKMVHPADWKTSDGAAWDERLWADEMMDALKNAGLDIDLIGCSLEVTQHPYADGLLYALPVNPQNEIHYTSHQRWEDAFVEGRCDKDAFGVIADFVRNIFLPADEGQDILVTSTDDGDDRHIATIGDEANDDCHFVKYAEACSVAFFENEGRYLTDDEQTSPEMVRGWLDDLRKSGVTDSHDLVALLDKEYPAAQG